MARIDVLRQSEEGENDCSAAISAKELEGFRKVIGWEHDLRKQPRFKRRRLNSADQEEEEVKNRHGAEEENKHSQKGPSTFELKFTTVPRVLSQARRRSPTPLAQRAFQGPLYASWKELIGPGLMLPCDGGERNPSIRPSPAPAKPAFRFNPLAAEFISRALGNRKRVRDGQ